MSLRRLLARLCRCRFHSLDSERLDQAIDAAVQATDETQRAAEGMAATTEEARARVDAVAASAALRLQKQKARRAVRERRGRGELFDLVDEALNGPSRARGTTRP